MFYTLGSLLYPDPSLSTELRTLYNLDFRVSKDGRISITRGRAGRTEGVSRDQCPWDIRRVLEAREMLKVREVMNTIKATHDDT